MPKLVPLLLLATVAGASAVWYFDLLRFFSPSPVSKVNFRDYAHGPTRAADVRAALEPRLREQLSILGLSFGSPVFIRAFKEEKELELWVQADDGSYHLFRNYPILATSGDPGPKLAEGDGQVPEGFYYVNESRLNPASSYHLAFNIGFPNGYDRSHGRTGSFIMVHGRAVSVGCLAMGDPAIEEIFTLAAAGLEDGQPFFRVHIFPFRMEEDAMTREAGGPHSDFWNNLKEGYDFFEEHRRPPNVAVENKRYTFTSE